MEGVSIVTGADNLSSSNYRVRPQPPKTIIIGGPQVWYVLYVYRAAAGNGDNKKINRSVCSVQQRPVHPSVLLCIFASLAVKYIFFNNYIMLTR
jgi:hypothetical protein